MVNQRGLSFKGCVGVDFTLLFKIRIYNYKNRISIIVVFILIIRDHPMNQSLGLYLGFLESLVQEQESCFAQAIEKVAEGTKFRVCCTSYLESQNSNRQPLISWRHEYRLTLVVYYSEDSFEHHIENCPAIFAVGWTLHTFTTDSLRKSLKPKPYCAAPSRCTCPVDLSIFGS